MKKSKQTIGVLGVVDPEHRFAHTKDLDSIIVHKSFRIFFKDDFLNDPVERVTIISSLGYIKNIIEEDEVQNNTLCVHINKNVIIVHIGKMKGITRFLLKREIE